MRAGWMVMFGAMLFLPLTTISSMAAEVASEPAIPSDSEMRVRIAWGGGERVAWRGQIQVDGGTFESARCLGNEPDAWSALIVRGNTMQIDSQRLQSYQAFDVTVRAPLTSKLTIKLLGRTGQESPRAITIPLTQLREESFNLPVDEAGNRVLVRRTPGDRLRVSMTRDHLVFSPGEPWDLEVQPWLISRDGFNPTNLHVSMVSTQSEHVLWRTEVGLGRDSSGVWRRHTLSVPVPDREGVYDLILRARQPRGIGILPTESPSHERRVQFVVIDPAAPAADSTAEWRETVAFDASQARWWESLARLSSLRQLSLSPMRLQGEGTARVEEWQNRSVSVLAAQQWQSYPLPILRPGSPHIVEVEYIGADVDNFQQTLGISVLQGGVNGSPRIQSLDAAIRSTAKVNNDGVSDEVPSRRDEGPVVPPQETAKSESPVVSRRLQLIFWPQSKSAQLLLTNLDVENDVAFGEIRLLEGPDRLPPAGARHSDHGFRTVLAHCDDPQFYRAFFATHGVDADANRELTDWITFQQGGQRFVDYLRHVGMGGASLTCVAQGGSLASLTSIAGTPRHDTGAYFSSGQDLFPKDVLEMLLRMFDREDLHLNVGVQFTTPLVTLEEYRHAGNAQGVELMDHRGNLYRDLSHSGESAYYNPLDPRVQQAMLQVVREIATRYGRHKSFAGIRIDLQATGFTQLPGLEWGCDPQTRAQFVRDMAAELPPGTRADVQASQLLSGPLQPLWIAWRQRRLTAFYGQVASEVRRIRPDAQVALHLAPLVEKGNAATASQPGSSSQSALSLAMEHMGLDLKKLADQPGITVMRPHTAAPLMPLAERGKLLEFSQNAVWQELASSLQPSAAITSAPWTTRSGMDVGELLGQQSSAIPLRSNVTLEDRFYRQSLNQALASHDARWLTVGGALPLTSVSDEVKAWIDVYRRLPASPFVRFENAKEESAEGHPVSVGTLSMAGHLYMYAVNESAWPVETAVSLSASKACRFADVGAAPEGARWARQDNGWQWQAHLRPYQLAAQLLTDPEARVRSVQTRIPNDVVSRLQQRLADATTRLNAVKTPIAFNELANPSFESPPPALEIPGWEWPREPGVSVARDTRVRHDGSASLRLESAQPVAWVRSDPIPIPRSGRLALQAMVRFELPAKSLPGTARPGVKQPICSPLRLAVEGTHEGKPYYRFAEVNAPLDVSETLTPHAPHAPQTPISPNANTARRTPASEWEPFLVQVNDLPVADLEQLRVRFDLMGPGRVWIDDVRLYDLSLTVDEKLEVSKIIALADFQLRSGRPADCAATLDRFWPLFLSEFVPTQIVAPRTPRNQNESATNNAAKNTTENATPNNPWFGTRPIVPRTGLLRRLRRVIPR